MRYAVYLPLLFPLLAAPAARPLGERLSPRLATWMLSAGALVLAAASTAVLAMLTTTGLLRFPLLARLAHGHWSAQAAQQHDPASLSVALLAGVLLAAAGSMAARTAWRRARALMHAATEAACLPGHDQLVVVDDPAADAYALPGRPGRIVISTGMLTALNPAEHEVLLAHERAHLAHHHYLFVASAHLAAAANPLLRPVAATVAYTVERWADESAATHTGDRRRVAHTVGKAALAAKRTTSRAWIPAGALGILGRLAPAGPGPVPRRVAALLAPPPHSHTLTVLVLAGLLLASGLCAAEAAHDLEALLELAKHAASRG
ncbi:M56 family metallopeptidase [Streptomyces sp. NPDC054883]